MKKKIVVAIVLIVASITSVHAEESAAENFFKGSGNGILNVVCSCAGLEFARSTVYETQDFYHKYGAITSPVGSLWGLVFHGTWRTIAYFSIGCCDIISGGNFGKMFYCDYFPEDFSTRWSPTVYEE